MPEVREGHIRAAVQYRPGSQRARAPRTVGLGKQTSSLEPRASSLEPQTSSVVPPGLTSL